MTEFEKNEEFFIALVEYIEKTIGVSLEVTPLEYANNRFHLRDCWTEKENFFYAAWKIQQAKIEALETDAIDTFTELAARKSIIEDCHEIIERQNLKLSKYNNNK